MTACLGVMMGWGPAWAGDNATQNQGAFSLGEIEVVEQSDGSPNVSVQRVDEQTMRAFNADTVDQAVNMLPSA